MIIIKYGNESEVQAITDEQTAKGLHLISISNVTEGNFLGFDDRDVVLPIQPVVINPYEAQIAELSDNQTAIMSGMADIYVALLAK